MSLFATLKTYSESNTVSVPTVDVLKQVAVSIKREPVYKSNAAAVSVIYMLEQDFCGYKQTLVNINESVEACNSSDLDVLVSLSNDLKEAEQAFLDIGHALFDAHKRFGCVSSEEPVESIYHDMLQRLMSAKRLLKDRNDHLSQVKAHRYALDESRQNLETLIENAYYASNNADDIPSVEHIITKID